MVCGPELYVLRFNRKPGTITKREALMMLWKERNKRVGLCVTAVAGCLILAVAWAVLAMPETALADPPAENPGGNVVKHDIPGVLKLTGADPDLTADDAQPPEYSNSEAGTSCFIGRRRSIWVTLSKTSPRSMNLDLSSELSVTDDDPTPGCDPWGVPTGITPPDLPIPDEGPMPIYQVSFSIAPYQNVSGLGNDPLLANAWLKFIDANGQRWEMYFGPGHADSGGEWGGDRHLTNKEGAPAAPPIQVVRTNPGVEEPKIWNADSLGAPGFLWYTGTKNNAPYVFAGKYDIDWSCTVESLP